MVCFPRKCMEKTYIEIAGLTVEINHTYPNVRQHCESYLVDAPQMCDIIAHTSKEQINRESVESERANGHSFSRGYLEDICLYRSIAEQLPHFDAFVFHGAAVNIDGAGFIFTAPSGTGKTTHVKLLMENYPNRVSIINGDKPVIRFCNDGVYVCSTPWAGKEDMKTNTRARLRGICILRRGESNSIRRIEPSAFFGEIIHQVYLPMESDAREKTLDLMNILGAKVNFYLLECNISPEAAQTSFGELSKS